MSQIDFLLRSIRLNPEPILAELSYGNLENQGYLYFEKLCKSSDITGNPKLSQLCNYLSNSSIYHYYLLKRYGYDVSKINKFDQQNIELFNDELENIDLYKYQNDTQLDDTNLYKIDDPYFVNMLGKYVTKLDLSSNELTSLPDSITTLVNLEILDLSNNNLTSLPESIGNLVNLKRLNLSRNQLTSLPKSFNDLVNLEILNLFLNQLETLPDTTNFNNLKRFIY